MFKTIAIVLIFCFAADAFRIDDVPDAIIEQIRKQLQQTVNIQNPQHPPMMNRHQPQQKPADHQKPHSEIIDEKERVYVLPKNKNQQDGKPADEQVFVIEKEVLRRVVDDREPKQKPIGDDLFYDEKEHDGHIGKSVFLEMKEEQDDEYCGGKPGEEPEEDEEPEIIQQLNNFDIIADAILERRLDMMNHKNEMHEDEDEDHPHHGEDYYPHEHREKLMKKIRPAAKKISLPKPSHLTADEAKLWNQKLSEAINSQANKVAREKPKQKITNHLLEDLQF